MTTDRRGRIVSRLYGPGESRLDAPRLGRVCAEVTGLTGAGVMLISTDLPRGSVAASDEVSRQLERLQFELGEGPCVEAFRTDRPVLEPDLANPAVTRWPA